MRPIRGIQLRGSGLIKDFGWVFSGNVVYAACQWAIVLLLSKLGSPEKVGEYALGVAVVTPILVMANLQIRALVASDIQSHYSFRHYLKFRVVTLAAALAVLITLTASDKHSWHIRSIILVVGLAQSLEYFAETYFGLMQKSNRLDRMSHSLMMKGPLSLLALALGFYITRDVLWACVGLLLGRLVIVLSYDSKFRSPAESDSYGDWDWKPLFNLLRTAWPLGLIALLASLNGNIPRYFIEANGGTRSLGIFAALYSIVSIGTLFIGALGQSVFVPAATAYAAGDTRQFRAIVWQSTLLAGALGLAAVAIAATFGQRLLTVLYRPEYADRDLLVQLMIVGGMYWIATAQGYVLTAIRRLKGQVVVLVPTVAIALGACAWLVPSMGAMGAAHALQASVAVQCAGGAYLLWKARSEIATRSNEASLTAPARSYVVTADETGT